MIHAIRSNEPNEEAARVEMKNNGAFISAIGLVAMASLNCANRKEQAILA